MSNLKSPCLISDARICINQTDNDLIFVIGTGSSEFKEDIDSVMEVIKELGLNGYFALLSEKEKGLDAFCDKICSKIKNSIFCIALLNDPISSKKIIDTDGTFAKVRAPSANVYYEFGLAVAFGKPVIPVVKKGLKLPFDVQHLDFILYADTAELKQKLKKTIVATLRKPQKIVSSENLKLVELVYGPLYNEVRRFLSKRDRFTSFNHPQFGSILTNYSYLFDTINKRLRKKILSFYDRLDEFNVLLDDAKKIVDKILEEEIAYWFAVSPDSRTSISVELETAKHTISPTLNQILIRNVTPETFIDTQGSHRIIKNITYRLNIFNNPSVKISRNRFRNFFENTQRRVENERNIRRLRELAKNLKANAEILKEKIGRLCQ